MKLSTKSRYAVMALAEVAKESASRVVPLAALAETLCLSQTYLEQIFHKLKKNGLVISTRGTSGGYELSKPPSEISVYDIILAVDMPVKVLRCHDKMQGCIDGKRCQTHNLWHDLEFIIRDFLSQLTLADVVYGHKTFPTLTLQRPSVMVHNA